MSRRQFKSQASSGRAGDSLGGFGSSAFGTGQSSVLSYIQEPPSYSAITNANVVVAFKNLSKKDETTKAKALEDLQSHIASTDTDIEDAFLEAWAKLFPRLSIDNSRRVRQAAHILNGQVCSKSGKRVAKHLPTIAGPWLAGTFDNDRAVSRAAADSLSLVFPTAEKIQGLRKAFQKSILEYSRDAALHETVQTLSDERVVSADDAQATYSRVVSTALSVVNSLLVELAPEVVGSEAELYQEVLQDPKLWDFANYSDATVRRSVHRLAQTSLVRTPDLLQQNVRTISTAYVYKGLHSDQNGSVLDYLRTLEALTTTLPAIWTEEYSGKKPAASRLRHFLQKGSQSASNSFWESLDSLFLKLPSQVLPKNPQDIEEMLSAARSGVSKKEERFNPSAAWTTYFHLAELLTSPLSQTEADPVVETQIIPAVWQYIYPEPETAEWTISGGKAASVVSRVVTVQKAILPIARVWPQLEDKLIETAKTSQPQQSKDFDKSQKHVATTGERWADLQREIFNTQATEELQLALTSTSERVLHACIELLKARNGKPYGAAAIIEQLLRSCGKHLIQDGAILETYFAFATNDLPRMIFTPSQRHLIHGLYALSSQPRFSDSFDHLLDGLLHAAESQDVKVTALCTVFTASMPTEGIRVAKDKEQIQDFLVDAFSTSPTASVTGLFTEAVKLGIASETTTDAVLSKLTASLTTSDQTEEVLPAIDALSQTDSSVINTFASQTHGSGSQLLPNLLKLEQGSNDEIAEKAVALSAKLSSSMNGVNSNKYGVVLQNLEKTSKASLSVEAVIELAFRLMGPEKKVDDSADVLPPTNIWVESICTAIRSPSTSLALLSPFGGAIHFLKRNETTKKAGEFDNEGFSQALRIAMYLSRLLTETDMLQSMDESKALIFAFLHVIVLAAEDNMSVRGSNNLFSTSTGLHGETSVLDFTSEANKLLNSFWSMLTPDLGLDASGDFILFCVALESLRGEEQSLSPLFYYTWLSYSIAVSNIFGIHGYAHAQVSAGEEMLKVHRSTKQLIPLAATISGLRQPLSGSQTLVRFCNELVSDLTDLDIATNRQQGLEQLTLLNIILNTQEDMISAIAKQRVIFLAKALIRWLNQKVPVAVKVEVCKALAQVLPSIHDIYGDHWDQVITFLVDCWSSHDAEATNDEAGILLMNSSLKLYGALKRLARSEEPNDDLVDALKDYADRIREALIRLLITTSGLDDDSNQPLQITHELLARHLAALAPKPLEQAEDIYPLLNSRSRSIMQAAFDMLHVHIPAAQEQISFNAALDDKTAKLPDELLSLILESPTLDSLAEASFDRMMPLSLQEYLYSWRLLFDHFDGSSFRVKTDYIEQLKEGDNLSALLNFTFDFLGHTRGKPVDVSKFDISTYIPDVEPSPEKDVQWLLTHLYFLALTHTPSLVKSYYLDIRSRQTSSAIETWTAKHLSPLIISTSLQSVAKWAENSVEEDPEYERMAVKVGMRSKEIHVSYVVDEQTMAIKVILPEAYPLASAQVVSVNRVAAKEIQWQSWLRNCQGVITFSNGSIIDGLTAWRKNVTGALKGQTECAICYSIISADKQLPTKRCPTCKHLFHASCLFKWFKTSNASTCPLCRNPFNFN